MDPTTCPELLKLELLTVGLGVGGGGAFEPGAGELFAGEAAWLLWSVRSHISVISILA